MNFNDRRALDLLPARIAALETRITELNAVLADPDLYRRDPARFRDTTDALVVTRDELAAAEDPWRRLEMLREEIEGIVPTSHMQGGSRARTEKIIRHAFVKQVTAAGGVRGPRIDATFAAVAREDFLGPGP